MEALHTLAWPLARLGEAIETLARHRSLPLLQRETPTPPEGLGGEGGAELGPWLEAAAAWLGLEAEPVEASYVDIAGLVRRAGPALLRLPGVGTPCFLALLWGVIEAEAVEALALNGGMLGVMAGIELGMAPAFLTWATTPAVLAVNLGGVLLAAAAYKKLATGLWQLAGAAIAWQHVAPLFHAAARQDLASAPPLVLATSADAGPTGETSPVLEAHDLVFRYRERGAPVLHGCSLRLWPRERLLLEGPSGGGKSTLGTLLLGLRQPESGLVLLDGLDRHTLGAEGWRRVVAAPQFQDNHVFTGTVAFNLLMGRPWPPHPEDMVQAEALCRALGLGPLLDRMPAGLLQMVGESGWQLSQGERSRLYIARTLLQGANCLILDESFAALDPETLRQALQCVLDRAPTLLVIAHP